MKMSKKAREELEKLSSRSTKHNFRKKR